MASDPKKEPIGRKKGGNNKGGGGGGSGPYTGRKGGALSSGISGGGSSSSSSVEDITACSCIVVLDCPRTPVTDEDVATEGAVADKVDGRVDGTRTSDDSAELVLLPLLEFGRGAVVDIVEEGTGRDNGGCTSKDTAAADKGVAFVLGLWLSLFVGDGFFEADAIVLIAWL